jgi:hypothetical protein
MRNRLVLPFVLVCMAGCSNGLPSREGNPGAFRPKAYVDALGAAVEPLIAALKYPQPEVRWLAAQKLEKIDDPRAVSALLAALKECLYTLDLSGTPGMSSSQRSEFFAPAERCFANMPVIAGAYDFYIKRGIPDSEDVLVSAFDYTDSHYFIGGFLVTLAPDFSMEMAEAFLNCGNSKLGHAASEWASRRGYRIISFPGGGGGHVQWGSGRSP